MNDSSNMIITEVRSKYIITFREKIYTFGFSSKCSLQENLEVVKFLKDELEKTIKKKQLDKSIANEENKTKEKK